MTIHRFLQGRSFGVAHVCSLLLLSLCLFCGACTALLDPGPPPSRLQLDPSLPARMMDKPLNKQLVVSQPVAGPDVDTDTISLVFNGIEVRSLRDARWTGTVPFIVQRSLINALEATNALRGVGDEMAGIAANARLLIDIKQLALHYPSEKGVPTAVFEATFRLVSLDTGKIVGTRSIEVKVPSAGRDNAALAKACEAALSQGIGETTTWVVGQMRTI